MDVVKADCPLKGHRNPFNFKPKLRDSIKAEPINILINTAHNSLFFLEIKISKQPGKFVITSKIQNKTY